MLVAQGTVPGWPPCRVKIQLVLQPPTIASTTSSAARKELSSMADRNFIQPAKMNQHVGDVEIT